MNSQHFNYILFSHDLNCNEDSKSYHILGYDFQTYNCSPILIDTEVKVLDKLQTQLMKCTRPVLGFSSFKMSTLQIMSELRIQTVHQMIVRDSIMFIHKVLTKKTPGVIFKLFCQSNTENNRDVKKFRVKFVHKSSKVTNSLFYRSLYLLNCLPTDIRNTNTKKISKYLQENLNYIFPYNKIPKANEST